jgi:hypothetical protein
MLQRAKTNYWEKYAEYQEQQLKDYTEMVARQAEIRGENAKDLRRETARQSCVNLAEMSALPKSAEPPSGVLGGILIGVILALAVTAICVLSCGTGIGGLAAAASITSSVVAGTNSTAAAMSIAAAYISGVTAAALGAAGAATMIGLGINDAIQGKNTPVKTSETFDTSNMYDYEGAYKITHWNYKEDITTIFNPIDLTCEKCVVATHCEKTHAPMFGDQYCKEWKEPLPKTCTTIQF